MSAQPLSSSTRQNIWITGASTGIGRDLALSFAYDGHRVAVSARSADKLRELEALSSNISVYPVDVTDAIAVAETAAAIERELGPLDLAILNAGVWHPMTASRYDLAKVKTSMEVNYYGVTNALDPVMKAMMARGRGHLAIVSSVAGYRGLPKGAAYAPTKAALISLAESLYADLKIKGVRMTVINPGFVATPMTEANTFPMPFIVSTEDAVKAIRRGLDTGRFEIVFPGRMALVMKTLRLLPYRIFFLATGAIAKREPPQV
jgi:short-subunit dehydrogenase